MTDDYIQLGSISKEIQALQQKIQHLILIGDSDEVNAYLKKAAAETQYAIAHLKNAIFEAVTSPELNEEFRKQKEQPTIHVIETKQETTQALTEFAVVNDPQAAKRFFDEFDIPYKEITRGENKGKLKIKTVRYKDYDQRMTAERLLRKAHLEIIIDHPNVFRDKYDNAIVTFSPYDIDRLPKKLSWLEMSDHSIYGNGTKTFVVRCFELSK